MHDFVSISSELLFFGVQALNSISRAWQICYISANFEDFLGLSAVILVSIQMLNGFGIYKSTLKKDVPCEERNFLVLRPSWNIVFSIVIKFLRTVAYTIIRDVKFIRILTDHELPKFLLSSTVKCHKSDDHPGEWFTPSNESSESNSLVRRYILYFHGGAFCLCGPETHRDLISRLVQATGAHVFAVKYRRPPENPFPAALEDGLAAYAMLLRKVDASRIIFAGDSAGGNLAVTTILACASRQLPPPAGTHQSVPNSPFLHFRARACPEFLGTIRDVIFCHSRLSHGRRRAALPLAGPRR